LTTASGYNPSFLKAQYFGKSMASVNSAENTKTQLVAP